MSLWGGSLVRCAITKGLLFMNGLWPRWRHRSSMDSIVYRCWDQAWPSKTRTFHFQVEVDWIDIQGRLEVWSQLAVILLRYRHDFYSIAGYDKWLSIPTQNSEEQFFFMHLCLMCLNKHHQSHFVMALLTCHIESIFSYWCYWCCFLLDTSSW